MSYTAHSFSVELATKVGLKETLLLQHFYYWYQTNRNNPAMFKDGRVWCFSSRRNILSVFPYLTDMKIRNAVANLIDKGFLIKGDYPKSSMDKTSWYALTDSGIALFEGTHAPSEDSSDTPAKETAPSVEETAPSVKRSSVYNNNINNNIKKDIILKDNIERKKTDEEIISEKRDSFRRECEPYIQRYGQKMVEDFVYYWSESSGKYLKWEIAKRKSGCFEVSRRMATWAANNKHQQNGVYPTPQDPGTPRPKKKIWEEMGVTEEFYRTEILGK